MLTHYLSRFVVISLTLFVMHSNATGYAQTRESLQQELDSIVRQLNENQSWIEKTDNTLAILGKAITNADLRVNELGTSIIESTQEIEEIDKAIVNLQGEQKRWEILKYFQSKKLAWHVYALSLLGRRNPIMFILGEDDQLRADRLARHHGYLINTGIPAMEHYESLEKALVVKTAELSNKKEQRSETSERLTKEKGKLEREQQQRKALTITLTRQLKSTQKTAIRLESDRLRLTQLLSNLRTSTASNTAAPSFTNSHWPVRGKVIHRFGEPRAGGRLTWQGVFVEAEAGASVRAMASGQVRFSGYFKGFGMAMVIDHGEGLISVYAHCNVLLKQNGDLVEAAEVIAQAGQSGGLPDTGLYLELRLNDKPIDPLSWFEEISQ